MKASERLRLEASLGNNVYQPWPMVALREAADLLDECQRAFVRVRDYSSDPHLVNLADVTLAKLRGEK